MRPAAAGALAPLTQFFTPGRTGRLLGDPAAASSAMAASLLAAVLACASPLLYVDLGPAVAGLGGEVRQQAILDGMSPSQADSAAAAGMEEARLGAAVLLPGSLLLERAVMAVLAASAAFGVYRAWGSGDRYTAHLRAAVLAQAGFAVVWALTTALEFAVPDAALLTRPETLLAGPLAPQGRLSVFAALILSGCNPAAAAAVILWGLGMASATGRPPSNGLSTASGIYLLGLVLFSTPVLLGG